MRKLSWWVEKDSGLPPTWARTATCGRCIGSEVEIRCTCQGGAYPCNIETCGNVWACAVCSAKIRSRRGVEVGQGAAAWVASGGSLGMLTLTVRHNEWMKLRDVLTAVTGSWRKLQTRKEYRALRRHMGGSIKAVEVTVGDNGWHPHIHLLLFVNPGVDPAEVEALTAALFYPWQELVGRSLAGVLPSVERGVHFKWTDASAADYVSKIGFEVASADTKSGRDAFALLDDSLNGELGAFFRCIEFFDVMKGRHSLDWSPGLRHRLGLGDGKSDEELAQEDEGGELVEYVDGRVWNHALATFDENGVPVAVGILQEIEEKWRNRRESG